MSWRRKKRKQGGHESPPTTPQSAPPSGSNLPRPAADLTAKARQTADFAPVFERVADMAKNDLARAGKVRTLACFVYAGDLKEDSSKSPNIKTVSLSWKTEFQKELIRKRIRDKALLEEASAVVIVTDALTGPVNERPDKSLQRKGTILISGTSPSTNVSASLTYALEREIKTVSLGEMQWLDEPSYNFFLDGVLTKRLERGPKGPQTGEGSL